MKNIKFFINHHLLFLCTLIIFWRSLLFIVSAIAPNIIHTYGNRFPYVERLKESGLPYWVWSFGNFDGVHYLGIAKNAYDFQFTQAFFPFYPILIKLFSFLTFGNLLISALLISNVCFLIGLIIFYKLVNIYFDKKIAFWSCLFLLAFPTSFYFGAVYTEGLFFLQTIAAFYLLEKNKKYLSLIFGFLASATRLPGIFLSFVLFKGKGVSKLASLLVVPLGLIAYVIYLKIKFNNPLYFLTAQQVFGQERSTTHIILLPQVIYRYLKILATTSGLTFTNALFELVATVFALTILFLAIGKIKKEWLIFSFLAVLAPTLTGTLASMPRYILIAFPIYVVLASINNFVVKSLILFIFCVILAITLAFFSQGYWVA